MRLMNYLNNSPLTHPLLLLSSLFLLSNCGLMAKPPEPQVVIQTEYISRTIPLQGQPKPVQLVDVKWYVVTEENLAQFLEQFKKDNGAIAFMVVSVQGYENISMNIQDLRRYILQQKSIIVYYENAAQEPAKPPETPAK